MENPNATSAIPYLVSTNQMDHDEDIGNVDEPVWVEESEARQQISRSVVTKGSIPNESNSHVETSCDKNGCGGGFLHLRRLRWLSLQCVLQAWHRQTRLRNQNCGSGLKTWPELIPQWYESDDRLLKLHLSARLDKVLRSVCMYESIGKMCWHAVRSLACTLENLKYGQSCCTSGRIAGLPHRSGVDQHNCKHHNNDNNKYNHNNLVFQLMMSWISATASMCCS